MTGPSIDRAASAVGELSVSVRALTDEVKYAEAMREDKVRWLQRAIITAGAAIGVLVVLVVANFIVLSRTEDSATEARKTNELLLGCFQPNTTCSQENTRRSAAILDNIRQTQFVISVCQRQNPLPSEPTAGEVDAATRKLQLCVQSYYPGFTLPSKVASPAPTAAATP